MTSTIIVFCLIPIALLGLMFLFIRLILSGRYKYSAAPKIVIAIFVLSFFAAVAYYKIATDDFNENHLDYVNPAIAWQKVDLISELASSLEYRSDVGLFAITNEGEKQLTKAVPYCRIENQSIEILPEKIEITDTSFAEIPAPPHAFRQQIVFDIRYAVEHDTEAISSFVVLDNGEVWCTKRVFRGPADFPAFALLGLGIMITATSIFIGSLFGLLLLTLIGFEIHRWQRDRISV